VGEAANETDLVLLALAVHHRTLEVKEVGITETLSWGIRFWCSFKILDFGFGHDIHLTKFI
jgi:hypothetical protein